MALRLNRQTFACVTIFIATSALGIFYLLPAQPGILVADPAELRLEMKFGAKQDAYVQLQNSGKTSVTISGVSSSCGCTVGTPEATQLDPGKSTRLKVEASASSIGRKSAVVNVAYQSSNERKMVRVPVAINTAEAPGTRVLSYPKDLVAQCDSTSDSQIELEVRTSEKSESQPDLIEVTSADERCEFRLLGVENSETDRNGKVERCYRIEMVVHPSEPFAATATMRFREPLAAPAGNIAIFARHKPKTRVIPSVVDLPAKLVESSRQKHEVLLISETEIEDWKIVGNELLPQWLSVEVEKLRTNITRVTIADSRPLETKIDDVPNFELKLNSSAETVSLPVRIRE